MTLLHDFHARTASGLVGGVGCHALLTNEWPEPRHFAMLFLLAAVWAFVLVELRCRREAL